MYRQGRCHWEILLKNYVLLAAVLLFFPLTIVLYQHRLCCVDTIKTERALSLSEEHKPTPDKERQKMQKCPEPVSEQI